MQKSVIRGRLPPKSLEQSPKLKVGVDGEGNGEKVSLSPPD